MASTIEIAIVAVDLAGQVIEGVTDKIRGMADVALDTVQALAGIAAAAAGIATAGLVWSTAEALESEEAIAMLDATLRATAPSLGIFTEEVKKMGEEGLAKLGDKLETAEQRLAIMQARYDAAKKPTEAMTLALGFQREKVAELQRLWAEGNETMLVTTERSQMTRDALLELASAIQDVTRYSDEEVIAAETVMLRFDDINKEIFPVAIRLATDYATIMGTDLVVAAEAIGRALQNPEAGIGRLNTKMEIFNKEQIEMIKEMAASGDVAGAQALIIEGLTSKMGGLAEEMGKTTEGQWIIFKNNLSEIGEIIGDAVLPALNEFLGWLKAQLPYLEDWAVKIADFLSNVGSVIGAIIDAGFNSIEAKEALTLFFSDETIDKLEPVLDLLDRAATVIGSVFDAGIDSSEFRESWEWLLDWFRDMWNNIDWAALGDRLDTFVANMIQRIDMAVTNWVDSGGADELGAKFLNWVNALADPDNPELKSKTMTAALNLMRTLIRAFAALPWEEFYIGFTRLIGDALRAVDWEGIFVWLMEAVGKVFVGAIAAALNVAGYALKTVIDGFINLIKQFFGVSSPSTVFAEIGRELVMGLLLGWQTAFTILLSVVTFDLARLAALFTGSLSGFLGGDASIGVQGDASSLLGGSTGTVGSRTVSRTGATASSGTVNNYYYGPVYFGAAGEPGAYYDCPSPNPILTATASGGTMGGRTMVR